MSEYKIQIHKYKNGHQLVSSNIELGRADQDTVDRLSDISGQIRPGEKFNPYYTCYPLPSKLFFVIARTWQDLLAPRAGCVITKSLLIPMSIWENIEDLNNIFSSLNKAPDLENIVNVAVSYGFELKKNYEFSPLNEIVEALFLEKRKPILLFDCPNAEEIIYKLYTVFWPNMRSSFSICTFALAPRSLDGKPFDMLFSISSLRSRFADWNGRRIDNNIQNQKEARHRWTSELVKNIFKSDPPKLFNIDTSEFFKHNELNEESSVRLSLLWNELLLKVKAESSPIAILGLLDIINSQPNFPINLYKSLEFDLNIAINNAPDLLPTVDCWKFYTALLFKHRKKLMNREMLKMVKLKLCLLSYSDPYTSIEFVDNLRPSLQDIPAIIYSGTGDGLAAYINTNHLEVIKRIESNLGIQLLATSSKFVEALMAELTVGNEIINEKVFNYIEAGDEKAKNRAITKISSQINKPSHDKVLKLLLQNSNVQTYQSLLLSTANNTEFKFRAFDNIIIEKTKLLKEEQFLLNLLVKFDKKDITDNLYVKIVEYQPHLIEWIYACADLSIDRKEIILGKILNQLTPESLRQISSNSHLVISLINLLINKKGAKQDTIGRIILSSDIPIEFALAKINELPTRIINSSNEEILMPFIVKLFKNWRGIQTEFSVFISKLNQINTDRVVNQVIRRNSRNHETIESLKILLLSGKSLQGSLVYVIDNVSALLASSKGDELSEKITNRWVELLNASKDFEKKKNASFSMVDYAFKCEVIDSTNLLIASFPIVYKTFLAGQTISQYFIFSFFTDWDKCKTLRYDLIKKYNSTNWSKLGLLKVAAATKILKEVLKILNDSKDGKKNIDKAFKELKESKIDNTSIMKELDKVLKKL